MSINSTSTQNYQNLFGAGITYAQISPVPDPSLLSNQNVIYQTSDGKLWQSNGTAIVAFTGGGSGGDGVWGSITGELSNQTDLQDALNAKTDDLAAATLGAGSTNITRASHLNRPLTVDQAGATTGVFAATATSGALAGDGFELLNVGAGTFTASGDISAATGYTLTAATGATFTALYDSATDAFYSTTPAASAGGSADPSNLLLSGFGALVPASAGANNFFALGAAYGLLLDSSTLGYATTTGSTGYAYRPRTLVQSATAAINRSAGFAGNGDNLRLDDGSVLWGRFPFCIGGAISDAVTTARFFMGLAGTTAWGTALNSAEPSAVTFDKIGIGVDTTDTNMQFMFGGNGGSSTKIDMGSGFPPSQRVGYVLKITKNADGSALSVVVTNVNTDAVFTKTVTSTDGTLPSTSILYQHVLARASAANASTVTVDSLGFTMGTPA